MQVRVLIVGAALVFTGERSALAAEGEPLRLEVSPACRGVDVAQLRRLLAIEAQRDERARQALVSVSCEGGAASLRVRPLDDGRRERARTFVERDVAGEVGARVLSLAAVELLNQSGAPPEGLVPAPPPPPPERDEPPAPTPEPPRALPTVRLMLAGSAYSFGFDQALAGGGISVDFLRLSKLGLRLDLGMAVGGRRYDLGEARVQLTSMSAQVGYLALHRTWTARAMLGYRFGRARLSGEATTEGGQEGTVSGACGGPLLAGGLGLRSGSFATELSAEAGLVSFPLEGQVEGSSSLELDGYWVGLSLNVGTLL